MIEPIIRNGRKEGFTVLYNSMVNDPRLTFAAKGLFAYMMSKPPEWEFTISGISADTHASKGEVRKNIALLEQVGYLLREQKHKDDGTFGANVYVLQDFAPPLSTNADNGENRQRLTPSSDFRTEKNKDINNIPPIIPQGDKPTKTRKSRSTPAWKPERFEKFWTYYRNHARGEDRAGAVQAWDRLRPDDDLIDTMARALAAQVETTDWKRGIGIPYACRWIRNERWRDVLPAPREPAEPEEPPMRRYVGKRIIDGQEVDVYE